MLDAASPARWLAAKAAAAAPDELVRQRGLEPAREVFGRPLARSPRSRKSRLRQGAHTGSGRGDNVLDGSDVIWKTLRAFEASHPRPGEVRLRRGGQLAP